MRFIDKLKVRFLYSKFINSNVNEELLSLAMSDKEFKSKYKSTILPFVKELEQSDSKSIDSHLNSLLQAFEDDKLDTYINNASIYKEKSYNYSNYKVLSDKNFQNIVLELHDNELPSNIEKIIEDGYSDRYLTCLNKYLNGETISYKDKKQVNPALLHDNVWNVVENNAKICGIEMSKIVSGQISQDRLIELVENNLYEGFIHSYEISPYKTMFINKFNNPEKLSTSLPPLDMEFIRNVGDDNLKKLYSIKRGIKGRGENSLPNLHKLSELKNYDLIKQIIRYDSYYILESISEEDTNKKDIIEVSGSYKKQIFADRYFGIDETEFEYLDVFCDAIKKIEQPKEYAEKYADIIQFMETFLKLTDEQILDARKNFSEENREKYKNILKEAELEGNNLIRNEFSNQLKEHSQEIQQKSVHEVIHTKNNKDIDVYKLEGEQFTMMVHNVHVNKLNHGELANKILQDPKEFNEKHEANNHISASLISDEYMFTYGFADGREENSLVFGFSDVTPDSILQMETGDMGSNIKSDLLPANEHSNRNSLRSNGLINTVVTPDELMKRTIKRNKNLANTNVNRYNEILLPRENIKPDYIVCFDGINEISKKAAEEFDIPIYFVDRQKYSKLAYRRNIEEIDDLIEKGYSREEAIKKYEEMTLNGLTKEQLKEMKESIDQHLNQEQGQTLTKSM